MNLTCHTEALAAEIRRLAKITAEKGALPVLSNILFSATDTLRLSATDLQVELSTSCDAQIAEPGATTLPAKKLQELLDQLSGPVTIEEQKGHVRLTAGTFKSRLQTLPASEFPTTHEPSGDVVELSASALRMMIERTAYAISDKTVSYVLKGALLSLFGEVAALVATDGKRLSIATASRSAGPDLSTVIPTKTLEQLVGLCEGKTVEFSSNGQRVFFQAGKRLLSSPMLDGKFPSYERIVPRDTTINASLDRVALQAALKRVGAVAEEDKAITFALSPGWLTLSTRSRLVGDAEDQMPITYEGAEFQQAVNGSYVLDFLEHAVQSSVTIDCRPGSPLLFTDGPNFINVILGMKG